MISVQGQVGSPAQGMPGGRRPRVQFVSLLYVPIVAASSCPDSYLAAGSGACYFVTTETAPHWGCDALCGTDCSKMLAVASTMALSTPSQ